MASHLPIIFTILVAGLLVHASAAWVYFDNTNAVNGCGMSCTNQTAPFVCLGSFGSPSACEAACAKDSRCSIITWSANTGNCWTRTDGQWSVIVESGLVSGCNNSTVMGCVAPGPPYNGPITATVQTSSPIMKTHPLSPAVTLDFWRWDDPNFGQKWMNSSALEIDLTNPQLRALASALAPALLRLGGSPEDSLVFDTDGTCVPGTGGNGPAPKGYYCSQVHPYVYDCITPDRWNALLQFASETGLKITIGLNGCYGRMSSTTPMDFSNIEALLKATASSPYVSALWGFEFTNEVVPNTITPEAWAADITAVKIMAADIFSAAGLPLPNFVGPDQGGSSVIASVAQALPPGVVNAYTYHQYPECVAPSPAGSKS